MAKLQITLACGDYDRTHALADGTVQPEGIDTNFISLGAAEVIWRMLRHREFDVSEFSLSNYLMLRSRGDDSLVAIPIFPYRAFRHSMMWINTDTGIESPNDLRGKRVGVPEYSMTALLFLRGMLKHEYGIAPDDIFWFRSKPDRISFDIPDGLHLRDIDPGESTESMLENGELSAIASFWPPKAARVPSPRIRRLFTNTRETEIDYYCRTRIFPIMHVIVIRRQIYATNRWIVQSLIKAFEAAKNKCYERTQSLSALYSFSPWLRLDIEESQRLFGGDIYPYGIKQNLATLEAAALYSYEQGLSKELISVNDMFPPEAVDVS